LKVNQFSESNPLERKDAEGPSLDESLENEKHLDVDSCDSDSPKNVNNDSVSPSSRVLREEKDVRGVESDLVDSFEECEIRDNSVLYCNAPTQKGRSITNMV
ncbi:hypothetical protein Tco_0440947, partial [Tanacetum coccineum]